jgi:chemotaxis protein CheC
MITDQQLAALSILFQQGSDEASVALSKWLERPSRISVEQVEQVPLGVAASVLGEREDPICSCAMSLDGHISGHLLLAFDDPSGLALADLLLGNRVGASTEWGEVQRSAALETANIIGCAYLNAIAKSLADVTCAPGELLPSPPRFVRDFAESVMQFALMNQAVASDLVFLTRTEFRIADTPVNCSLLFVPDARCSSRLKEMLPA